MKGHLIVLILSLMIVLSFGQMLLRNFFDMGIVWGDTLLRQWVLWVGFLGASIAVRHDKHIPLRFFPVYRRFLGNGLLKLLRDFQLALSAAFWPGPAWSFMLFEKDAESVLFLNIPVWIFQTISAYSFMIIAIRFIISGAVF